MENRKLAKIFALTIVIIGGAFLIYMLAPFLIPIFLGFVVAYLFYPLYSYFEKKTKKSTLSASLTIVSIILLVVIPLSIITVMVYDQIIQANINVEQIQQIENQINQYLGTQFSFTQFATSLKTLFIDNIQQYSQTIVSTTSTFLLNLFIFFFTLFYALIENKRFYNLSIKYLPFSQKQSKHVLTQGGYAIKALLIGQFLTAVIQGILGMISFFIAGIQGAFFWGIVMIILSLIPVVGAFLVWLPAGLLLLYQGDITMGIFILAWGGLVVSQIDNLIRPKLVNRYFDLHPLLILLGVFAGLSLFGIVGLLIGPLVMALFILVLQTYEQEYMNKNG